MNFICDNMTELLKFSTVHGLIKRINRTHILLAPGMHFFSFVAFVFLSAGFLVIIAANLVAFKMYNITYTSFYYYMVPVSFSVLMQIVVYISLPTAVRVHSKSKSVLCKARYKVCSKRLKQMHRAAREVVFSAAIDQLTLFKIKRPVIRKYYGYIISTSVDCLLAFI